MTEGAGGAWFEAAFGALYVELYAHRDEGEAEALLDTLSPFLPAGGPVLDLACGSGRLLVVLARRYPEAVGLDLSSDLLRGAARQIPPGRLIRADMRDLPLVPGRFSAVFSLFTSFGYFDDPAEDGAVLRAAAARLRPGGTFVLDFLNAPRVIASLVPFSRQRLGVREVESERRFDPVARILRKVVRVYEEGRLLSAHEERVRAYAPGELDALFADAGLTLRARFGSYDGRAFESETSERYILVGCREGS